MARAFLRKEKKEYVIVQCDVCGKENKYELDRFILAYAIGKAVHCKYCGSALNLTLDKKVEQRVKRYMKKRGLAE